MKNKLLIFLTMISSLNCAELLSFIRGTKDKDSKDTSVIIAGEIAEKKHQLSVLKEEKDNEESNLTEFINSINTEIEKVKTKITEYESGLKKPNIEDTAFLNDSLNILKNILQLYNDIIFFKKQLNPLIEQQIKLLQEYINNPNFSNLRIEPQSYYSFDTLEILNQKILNFEETLGRLQDEKITIEAELENRKKDLVSLDKELKGALSEQKEFTDNLKSSSDFDAKQNAELIDLKIQHLETKKRLLEIKIKESILKLNVNSVKIFMAQTQLNVIKQDLKTVERKLRVYESDLEKETKKLDELKKNTSNTLVKLSNQIKNITDESQSTNTELRKIIKDFNIPQSTLNALSNWTIDVKGEKLDINLIKIGYLQDKTQADEYNIELVEAKKDYAQNKLHSEEIVNKIIATWHKITQKKLRSDIDEINTLKNEFESIKKDCTRTIALYKDKINTATGQINSHAKTLNTLKEKIDELKKRHEFYKEQNEEKTYQELLDLLKKAEGEISKQINYNSELIKAYSTILADTRDTRKHVEQLTSILDRIGGSVLYRSEYAISLNSLKSITPELKTFISDVKNILKTYISYMQVQNMWSFLKNLFSNIYLLLKILILFMLLFLLYLLLKKFLPFLANKLLEYKAPSKTINFFSKSFVAAFNFTTKHLLSLIIWSTLLILIKIEFITQIEHKLVFYLLSIPYTLYIFYKFLNYILEFNREQDYSIISEAFETRFYWVALFLSFSTITIFLFKEAFNITNYSKAELPTILDATWSVIFRACIIFLIGKEEILSIMPNKPKIWTWIKNTIDNYYYLILGVILILMIISDPYIGGFGKLVSYILWGIIGSVILIGFLSWLQAILRKLSLNAFFSVEEDTRKERFPYAKTFYGFFIIVMFIGFILFAIYFGSRIWGQPISFESFTSILNFKIFSVLGEDNKILPITIGSLFILLLFVTGGIFTSWIFEKFVLQKIFNVLLVDTGVQNTVSSISSYFIFILAAFIGLMNIGISSTTMSYFITALAIGLAFAIKSPANDFIGYFIILVERSIKIGDFVQFTMPGQLPITGVVRKITPRTIILRRKNSVNLVVPNSIVSNNAFYNWSYTNTFFAFDDILITTPYSSDPNRVKEILHQVLDNNSQVLKTPKPIIRLHKFEEFGFTFLVRGFLSTTNVLLQWDIASDIRISIVNEIRRHNIDIAVPVRMIITKKDGSQQIKEYTDI
jgi:small-conductance mechanosensitive channel